MLVSHFIVLQFGYMILSSGQTMDPAPVVRNQTAVNGSLVILPCSFPGEEIVGVCWYRTDKKSQQGHCDREYVLLHRDNNTSTTFQDAAYQNRVSLKDGLQGGNVSLLLRNVKYSDSGSYECQVFYRGIEGNEQKTVCVVNLTVKTSDGRNITAEDINRKNSNLPVALSVTTVCIVIIIIIIVLVYIKRKQKKKTMKSSYLSNYCKLFFYDDE
ncbi:myelin-oligodendrocyte glycoprotein-like [Thunnus maccoyii]|uniref:myelin-oligodendrocyte glycoprotein-like n=1 Tax=Thunnus maccoyii TaxID=8240 RepID=UPI001C4A7827|nr:myelin-oligodendrocyte glycoprotein-like [Thunnus maccoyii]